MPEDRPSSYDQPLGRAEGSDRPAGPSDGIERAGVTQEFGEREQGYDETYFRDPERPKDGVPGAPSRERVLWFRYHEAAEEGRNAGTADAGDVRDKGVRVTDEQLAVAEWSLPEVGDPRRAGERTTGHLFGANGEFLREEESGGRNADGTKDARVERAMTMMRDDLGWEHLGTVRPETHVETKVVVDMIEGRLPKDVAIVINNRICDSDPGYPSCAEFINGRLPDEHTVRVYNNDGSEPFFRKGTYRKDAR